MKRMFLILVVLLVAAVFSACGSCKQEQPVSKTVVAQVETKQQEAKPKAPQPMRETRTATQPNNAPKVDTKEPPPATEPKAEPKVAPKERQDGAVAREPAPGASTVSIVDHWLVPHPSSISPDLFAITFVVRNTSSKDVRVKVVCHFADGGALFGESIPQTIDANSEAKLMVRGFRRCPSGLECRESFDCRVEPTR
jgi:hypothetical protein